MPTVLPHTSSLAFSQSSLTSRVSASEGQFCAALKYEKHSMQLLNRAARVTALAATPITYAMMFTDLSKEHGAW